MAYSFQTFVVFEVLTSTKMNQVEVNIRDHIHGSGGVSAVPGTVTGPFDLSAAGAGQIKFPAAQNASADANTLDDYEEGTWTPVLSSDSGTITTVGAVSGTYTKIGRLTTVRGTFAVTTAGSAGGAFVVSGLPFSVVTPTPGSGNYNNIQASVQVLNSTFQIWKYDGTTVFLDNTVYRAQANYEV